MTTRNEKSSTRELELLKVKHSAAQKRTQKDAEQKSTEELHSRESRVQNMKSSNTTLQNYAPKRSTDPSKHGSEEIDFTMSDKLIEALQSATGKNLLVCIKGYPDPDNIGTSLALKWMARQFGINATILHFEEISHHENRALVKKLDLDIEHYTDEFDLSPFHYFAVNDSQNPELPVKLPEDCKLLAFVDHHKALGTVEARFLDIREHVGSTSAIYCEYLANPKFRFDGETPEQVRIATALMHGIRTDTDNFVNATPSDYQGSEFLSQYMDKELLTLISQQSIPARTMDLTQVALQRKDIRGNFMFSGVGYVRDEDRDGIGQCADYLLHREGIDTVVVFGVVNGQTIDGSLRTKSHTLDPDKWLKDVFGKDPKGTYYGGGRKDKGGFQIPIGVFSHCTDKELLWILIKKTIEELFYQKIGVDDRDMTSIDVE